MDDKFKDIVTNLEERRPRSQLEPYAGLIYELQRRGRTYRDIARILTEKCGIKASRSTINDFVRSRTRAKRDPRGVRAQKSIGEQRTNQGAFSHEVHSESQKHQMPLSDDVRRRIAVLKQRHAPVKKNAAAFQHDPDQPLLLSSSEKKTEVA